MAFKGDPLPKRLVQAALRPLGYKIVRAKAYDARMGNEERPNTGFNKLFCIGFNKTATTSLERALLDLGLRMPKQLEQEDILSDVVRGQGYQTLQRYCQDYDAFQDLPFSQSTVYLACDALFPGSKFILTVRDEQAWVKSYIRFYKREFGLEDVEIFSEDVFRDKTLYLKKGYVHSVFENLLIEHRGGQAVVRWDLAFDRDFLIDLYLRRNSEVIRYFSDRPDDLLVLDPGKEADTGRLLTFLEIDGVEAAPFPRENARN